jgi:Bacterial membrane protein YfhO
LRRRPTLAAALIYAALTMLFLSPGLLPGKTLSSSDTLWFEPPWVATKPAELAIPTNPDLADAPEQMQLFLHYAAREMPDLPLWNPYIVGGRPFHGNDQSSLFGPYTWPAYVLPFWTALSWIAVLKLWVAAFGTFLLARTLGMRFAGALLAGIVFALSLKLVTWLIYPSMGVWTWYPWLLFCADRVIKRPDLLSGAGLAAVVALQFLTGHPESNFHGLLLMSCFVVLRLWQARRAATPANRRPLTRPVLALAGAVAGGAAVAAVSLIPFAELLWLSADVVDRRGESVDNSLPFGDAVGIFMPDYWGRPTQTPIRPILLERALYVGALPLMLAAAALILGRTGTRVAIAAFGGVALAVVLGVAPFVQIVTRLPVFNSGHNTRLIVFTILAVALLAGWGLEELSAARRRSRLQRRTTIAVAVALLLLPLLIVAVRSPSALGALGGGFEIAWLFADPPGQFRDPQGEEAVRASALLIWLTVAGAGLVLLVLRIRRRVVTTAFVALALLLVCVDLFRAGMGQNPAIDQEHASVPKTGAIRFLERQRPARFVSTREIPQNVIPLEFRLYEARGYDIPIIRRFDRLWRREIVPGAPSVAAAFIDIPLELRDVTPRALRTLRLLGVTHLLGPKTVRPETPPFDRLIPSPPLRLPGLTQVYDGHDARVYRLDGALPRAWVVGAQRVVGSEDAALDAIVRPGIDARRVVVAEKRLPGLPDVRAPTTRPPVGGRARIVRYDPERVVVRAQTPRSGLVVLGDIHYPGWKAELDGRDVPIERVDYLFRGVRVGRGAHTIEFRYEPLSFTLGWIVSAIALLALALAMVVGFRRRSLHGADRPPQAVKPLERGEPARA